MRNFQPIARGSVGEGRAPSFRTDIAKTMAGEGRNSGSTAGAAPLMPNPAITKGPARSSTVNLTPNPKGPSKVRQAPGLAKPTPLQLATALNKMNTKGWPE